MILNSIMLALLTIFPAESNEGDPVDNMHFLVHGKTIEILMNQDGDKVVGDVMMIMYQEEEIYAAIRSDEYGHYEFNLPVGHVYKLVYGGDEYVNKIIEIDASNLKVKTKGHKLKVDMGLFKPAPEVDYTVMKESVANFSYSDEYRKLIPDLDYSKDRSKEVFKVLRKTEKALK